jgi:N-methylhydantoinase A/oxoprolinase/acetone carboxylase beta subunit
VESCPQDEVLDIPVTPVTPVTTEGIASMHDIIMHDARALDETSKQRLQRHMHKLASAAQISFAERALLQDQNRFLSKMNNEAKVRRSAKSQVLGKAKVMSYEDLEEARAKRKEKEKAAAGKAARGRKRKAPALVVDVTEPRSQVMQAREADLARTPAKLTRGVPVPWRAPVAQMIPKNYRGGA